MRTDARREDNIRGSRAVIKSKLWKSLMAAFPGFFGGGKVKENVMAARTERKS